VVVGPAVVGDAAVDSVAVVSTAAADEPGAVADGWSDDEQATRVTAQQADSQMGGLHGLSKR
jgi:hypothetical protein